MMECEKTGLLPEYCAHCRKSDDDGVPPPNAGIGLPAIIRSHHAGKWVSAEEAMLRGHFGKGDHHV